MRRTAIDSRDIMGAIGLFALLYGLALWWVPAAWMVGGALVLGLALWSHLRKAT
jgi:hypothetical protein